VGPSVRCKDVRVSVQLHWSTTVTTLLIVAVAHFAESSFHFGLFDKSTIAPSARHDAGCRSVRPRHGAEFRPVPAVEESVRGVRARIIYATMVGRIYRRPISHGSSYGWSTGERPGTI